MTDTQDPRRAERVRMLKEIIQRLHEGASPDEVRLQLKTLVRETEASEIAEMEQTLIAGGLPVERIQAMCDLHSQVLRDILGEERESAPTPGHPVDTLRRENAALLLRVGEMRRALTEGARLPADEQRPRLQAIFNELMDIEKHYQRKEHLLFSCLERHGVTGPPTVMWGKDDEVRELLKRVATALRAPEMPAEGWPSVVEPALAAIAEMVFKEEKILLPMSLQTLSAQEWGEIWQQSPEYGWCLVEPRQGYQPPQGTAASPAPPATPADGVRLPSGTLSPEQLLGILHLLPVDVSFVDADDRVRFFTPNNERIFARSAAILGRKVQQCHPPQSVHMVEKILSDFRAGRQDVAEFWLEIQGRFIHIRYLAVRGDHGEYLGTMEVTQDATHLRALQGERRLLQYDAPDRTGERWTRAAAGDAD